MAIDRWICCEHGIFNLIDYLPMYIDQQSLQIQVMILNMTDLGT